MPGACYAAPTTITPASVSASPAKRNGVQNALPGSKPEKQHCPELDRNAKIGRRQIDRLFHFKRAIGAQRRKTQSVSGFLRRARMPQAPGGQPEPSKKMSPAPEGPRRTIATSPSRIRTSWPVTTMVRNVPSPARGGKPLRIGPSGSPKDALGGQGLAKNSPSPKFFRPWLSWATAAELRSLTFCRSFPERPALSRAGFRKEYAG